MIFCLVFAILGLAITTPFLVDHQAASAAFRRLAHCGLVKPVAQREPGFAVAVAVAFGPEGAGFKGEPFGAEIFYENPSGFL